MASSVVAAYNLPYYFGLPPLLALHLPSPHYCRNTPLFLMALLTVLLLASPARYCPCLVVEVEVGHKRMLCWNRHRSLSRLRELLLLLLLLERLILLALLGRGW